jgi:sugar (pentulose or hexulose) kinase
VASLDREVLRLDADSEVAFVPFLAGERGLGYRADATAALSGLSLATDAAALYRAAVEAVAVRLALADERLTEAVTSAPQVVAGGAAIARSPLWQRLVAAAFGRTINVSRDGEVSSRGAALLTLHGPGALDALVAGTRDLVKIEVDPTEQERLRSARARQLDLERRVLDDVG